MTDECKKTTASFLYNSIFNAPLFAIYTLIVFIFCKELHASPFQITLLIALKPLTAILSFYWSSLIHRKPHALKSRLMWTNFLGILPTFFFPFTDHLWFYIFAFGFYMTGYRAVIPGWMEILKQNMPLSRRSKIFSWGSSINYAMGMLLPLLFSQILDRHLLHWTTLFPLSAAFSCLNLYFMLRLTKVLPQEIETPQILTAHTVFIDPWKKCLQLMRERRDFAHFQVIFMLGGLGLMVMQPALPMFFTTTLQLSYTEMALAISACKGIGFLLTSRLWASWFSNVNIFFFNGIVTLFAALFPFVVMFGLYNVAWVYLAYLLYGTMQAGSELSWNLSGPVFSGEKESSSFTGVNVVLVGVRGSIGPALGGILCSLSGSSAALLAGALFCLLGASYGLLCNKRGLKIYSPSSRFLIK
jgi:hypothetical protein